MGDSTKQNKLQLCPQNLQADFWVFFQLLLKQMYKWIFPNIEQSVSGKILCSMQIILFLQLHEL